MENLGSGRRFRRLANQLAGRPGVKNPAALAYTIGARKYGAARMAELAAAGRRRADKAGSGSSGRRVKV